MQKLIKSIWLGPVTSGVLTFIAVCHINFIIGWLCFVPLFISLFYSSAKQSFKRGFIFGFVISCLAFYWMIPGSERFTGNSMIYGLAVFLISAFFLSLYFGILIYCFSVLKRINESRGFIINALFAASSFTVAEALLMMVSAGFPWFDFHSGNAMADNVYAIQPASFFGIHIITFVTVLVNYMVSFFIVQKQWKELFIPVSVILFYLLAGFFILQTFERNSPVNKTLHVAILAENIVPDIKWDDNTGNVLVERLLDLNRKATLLKPDIMLWSESAIPWTYSKDDDLVKEVLKITAPSHAVHIMGINTAYEENEVYNSAYCLLQDGTVAGRYDKQFLLSLIEQPLSGLLIPFFSSKGFFVRDDTTHSFPLSTPYGKAGIMICNESAVPAAASNMAMHGATFLCNLSNDGWFNDTYIVNMHFYNARLRAVETRKDVVINCNNGISGLIRASGNIEESQRNTEPYVSMVDVNTNNYESLASKYPFLFVYLCTVYILSIIALKIISKYKRTSK